MNTVNAQFLVRSLRGSAAQILLAFLFARKAMDVDEIRSWTNLKRQTIQDALPALRGLIARQVVEHGRVVWAPGSEFLPIFQLLIDTSEFPQLQMSEKRTSEPVVVVGSRSNSFPPSITTTTITNTQMSVFRTSDKEAALKVVLDEYGIVGRKRQQLISCEWVDADYVRAHVEYARGELSHWDNPVGMAITRMLEKVPSSSAIQGNKQSKRGDPLICETCHQTPCICSEHDDDCMCAYCRYDHPERFCSFLVGDLGKFWVCDHYVEPGHTYCSEHEEHEERKQ